MKLRFSPAGVIAVIALLVSLGGTAYAAGIFTPEEEVEIRKLSTEVFDGLIGDASVKRAATAGSADTASNAARANTATTALSATRATTANNSEQLGGLGADAYQRSIQGGCASGTSIASINSQGQVSCAAPAVRAIRAELSDGQERFFRFGDGLLLFVTCRSTEPRLLFANEGVRSANFNFFALKPGSTKVTGKVLVPAFSHNEPISPRLEGQFSWVTSQSITTLNIHAFDGDGFCEVTGTAVTVLG